MSLPDLFEAGAFIGICCEQRFPTNDSSALGLEKRAPFLGKERRAVRATIEFQKESSITLKQSRPHIVNEIFPVILCPFQPLTVFAPGYSMKADAMRGNEVEFVAQIRQRRLCIDSRYDAVNAEKLGRAPEERFVIGIESETFVAEDPAEVQKITGAAAKIEDAQRGRPIKPKVLHPFYVHTNPIVRVLISVDLSRLRPIRIILAEPYQLRPINGRQNPMRT